MTSQSGSDAPSPALNAQAPLLAPSIQRSLGQHLRAAYASLEDAQPDRFAVLIARLEAVLAALDLREDWSVKNRDVSPLWHLQS